jgi:hypothetical protein
MGKNLLLIRVLLLVAALTGRTAARAAEKPAPNDAVFKMEEESAFLCLEPLGIGIPRQAGLA